MLPNAGVDKIIFAATLYEFFRCLAELTDLFTVAITVKHKYSRLSLSRSRRDPLRHFEISVLRHIRCAELRKIPIEQSNFTIEHVI